MRVDLSLLALLICRSLRVFDLAVIRLAVDVRLFDIVDFEPRATPTCKPADGLSGADVKRAGRAYMILTTTVQTMKTAVNATFTVYLFTTIYAKNTAWAKMRPKGNRQRPSVTPDKAPTIESVADDPDKQLLAIPLVVFRVDMQQLVNRLARVCGTINYPYRVLHDG